jgi:hypothetical protein
MCDRTKFLEKYKFKEYSFEDVLIRTDDNNDIRKAKLYNFGTKFIYFNYYDYDKDTKTYNQKNNSSVCNKKNLKISYEDIDWQLYIIIKKGDPNYDKYFNEYIDETIKSDDI